MSYKQTEHGILRFNKISEKDIIILKYIEKYGPRKALLEIFKKIKRKNSEFSYSDIVYRYNRLIKKGKLQFRVFPNHFRLGLSFILVLFKIKMKYAEIFEEIIKKNPTLVYYVRKYGSENGYLTFFAVPMNYVKQFLEFVAFIKTIGIAESYKVYFKDQRVDAGLGFDWYDFNEGKIVWKWDEFVQEVIANKKIEFEEKNDVHFSYRPPDLSDVKILECLELKPAAKFSEIAKATNLPISHVKYHYEHHLIKKKYIDRFVVYVWLFEPNEAVGYYYSIIDFKDKKSMKAFAAALKGKKFVYSAITFANTNSLGLNLCLPHKQLLNFNKAMWDLAKEGIVEDYIVDIFDLRFAKAYALPYELIKDGVWSYPHEEIMKNIQNVLISYNLI
jgi:DNA-binding Lrp family transcriptional regulator